MSRELSGPQKRVLEVVARGGCLRGEPVQTINSLVTQGLITPGEGVGLTWEGREALTTGLGKVSKHVGGVVWCRLEGVEPPRGRKRLLQVWGAYGPCGVHLLKERTKSWRLYVAGGGEPVVVPLLGAWAALTAASEHLGRVRAPVWDL